VSATVDIGSRVILADAQDRAPASLGTVIDRDPHKDRDTIVEVLHDDKVRRWRQRSNLRCLGERTRSETHADLAADLVDLLGSEAPAWAKLEDAHA
jgi:hypothetical protein